MITFTQFLEAKGIRNISDTEMERVVSGEPYTSPIMKRINYLRVPDLSPEQAHVATQENPIVQSYMKHFQDVYKTQSRKPSKDRAWVLGLDIPDEEEGSGPSSPALPQLDPKRHIKTITKIAPGKHKSLDAQKFMRLYQKFFGKKPPENQP